MYMWQSRSAAASTAQHRPAAAAVSPPQTSSAATRSWHSRVKETPPAQRPSLDYGSLMQRRRLDTTSCPPLLLAPMEGLADAPFRRAFVATAGGFDEACTEFIRVPNSANSRRMVRGVTSSYDCQELGALPLAAQVMGSNKELLVACGARLVHGMGAPRLDLNCGCPANTVTGKMAGSSLLRDPHAMFDLVSEMVKAVGGVVPMTVKMRSGFDDTSLFEQNLLAVQEAGAAFVTIHPRTKRQKYDGRADWSLIAKARQLLSIPVVGNGDVVSVAAARQLLAETNCDAVMIGRAAVQDPLIFHRIRFAFSQDAATSSGGSSSSSSSSSSSAGTWEFDEPAVVCAFLRQYATNMEAAGWAQHSKKGMSQVGHFGHLKKVIRYLFSSQPQLMAEYTQLVRILPKDMSSEELLHKICDLVYQHWPASGPSQHMLINHMARA